MTTDAAASATTTQPAPNAEGQPETPDTLKARIAKLEADLKAERGRSRVAVASSEALAEMETRVSSTLQRALNIALSETDPAQREQKLKTVWERQALDRDIARRITEAQPKLDKLVEDSGKSWDDPSFADARKAWDSRSPEQALIMAQTVVMGERKGYSKEEVEQIVETKLKNAKLAGAAIDTGGGTGGGTVTNTPRTAADLNTYLRSERLAGRPVPKAKLKELFQKVQG